MDYTSEEVIAWLRTRDPKETYDYTQNDTCLFARFLEDLGHTHINCTPHHWVSHRGHGQISYDVNRAAVSSWNMGDALRHLVGAN